MQIDLAKLESDIEALLKKKPKAVIGIDGEVFSGKTTLTRHLGKRFGLKVVPLDSYLSDPKTRMDAFLDKERRGRLFEYWFDRVKVKDIFLDADTGHQAVIIDGTFLLAAIERKFLDVLILVSSRAGLKEERIRRMMENNSLLSPEEATVLDDIYEGSWGAYLKEFNVESVAIHTCIPGVLLV